MSCMGTINCMGYRGGGGGINYCTGRHYFCQLCPFCSGRSRIFKRGVPVAPAAEACRKREG